MNCDKFESILLDLDRAGRVGDEEKRAAEAHLDHCSRCASLQESWHGARRELALLAQETRSAEAPPRVEMRLRQEFRLEHRTAVPRKIAAGAVWSMAAAAAVLALVSWRSWQKERFSVGAEPRTSLRGSPNPAKGSPSGTAGELSPSEAGGENFPLLAENSGSDFMLLPGALPSENGESSVLRVRMQRGALSAYGWPVNEERAGEWIQVELLVDDEGVPQAVRLPN